MFEDLIEGQIVHFVTDNGKHRPAIIVDVGDRITGMVNMQIFTDCQNDLLHSISYEEKMKCIFWKSSILFDQSQCPNTWHFIERAQEKQINLKQTKSLELPKKAE